MDPSLMTPQPQDGASQMMMVNGAASPAAVNPGYGAVNPTMMPPAAAGPPGPQPPQMGFVTDPATGLPVGMMMAPPQALPLVPGMDPMMMPPAVDPEVGGAGVGGGADGTAAAGEAAAGAGHAASQDGPEDAESSEKAGTPLEQAGWMALYMCVPPLLLNAVFTALACVLSADTMISAVACSYRCSELGNWPCCTCDWPMLAKTDYSVAETSTTTTSTSVSSESPKPTGNEPVTKTFNAGPSGLSVNWSKNGRVTAVTGQAAQQGVVVGWTVLKVDGPSYSWNPKMALREAEATSNTKSYTVEFSQQMRETEKEAMENHTLYWNQMCMPDGLCCLFPRRGTRCCYNRHGEPTLGRSSSSSAAVMGVQLPRVYMTNVMCLTCFPVWFGGVSCCGVSACYTLGGHHPDEPAAWYLCRSDLTCSLCPLDTSGLYLCRIPCPTDPGARKYRSRMPNGRNEVTLTEASLYNIQQSEAYAKESLEMQKELTDAIERDIERDQFTNPSDMPRGCKNRDDLWKACQQNNRPRWGWCQ